MPIKHGKVIKNLRLHDVGIGTDNPSVPLEVSSNANTQFLVKTVSGFKY